MNSKRKYNVKVHMCMNIKALVYGLFMKLDNYVY